MKLKQVVVAVGECGRVEGHCGGGGLVGGVPVSVCVQSSLRTFHTSRCTKKKTPAEGNCEVYFSSRRAYQRLELYGHLKYG